MKILGRKSEKRELTACVDSKRPEFVAVYGRRRVGKTFLIREFFHNDFAFHLTGTFGETRSAQLAYFDAALAKYGGETADSTQTWREAFLKLEKKSRKKTRKNVDPNPKRAKTKARRFF
jgi:AAA+ ATPase superfamily predicted ATPase